VPESSQPVILFVDDEDAVLQSMRLALHKEPYSILTASSAREASEIIERTNVDVVVSDERMPAGSGSEPLFRLRRDHPGIVRIVLTGETNLAVTSHVIREGEPYRFLTKPVSPQELKSTIAHALRTRHLHRQAQA
jgi:DNA-binding NtrC family response regulator